MMNEMNMRTILHNENFFLNVCFFFLFQFAFFGGGIKVDKITFNYDIKATRKEILLIKTLKEV
jgi:hypothetical protein